MFVFWSYWDFYIHFWRCRAEHPLWGPCPMWRDLKVSGVSTPLSLEAASLSLTASILVKPDSFPNFPNILKLIITYYKRLHVSLFPNAIQNKQVIQRSVWSAFIHPIHLYVQLNFTCEVTRVIRSYPFSYLDFFVLFLWMWRSCTGSAGHEGAGGTLRGCNQRTSDIQAHNAMDSKVVTCQQET